MPVDPAQLERHGVVGVATSYVDNSGIARVKTVPLARLARAVRDGIGMSPVFDVFMFDDAITVSPSSTGPVGDLRLFPDLERLVVLAAQPGWAWAPLDRRTQDGDAHPLCQRTFARRMAGRLAERGLAARMGFETEWTIDPPAAGPAYGMDRLIEASDYCRNVLEAFAAQGVEVEQLHPEYAPGQFELAVAPSDPVGAADDVLLTRHTLRAVSARVGLRASFAPMVEAGVVGNGCHLHVSLWRDGSTLMGRPLAPEAEAFAAGVLDGLPALLAIGAPSVASYLRLVPQRWAAPFQVWGFENREAALRLVGGTAPNVEVKAIDAAANPYLLVGAVIALGLDGIDRGLRLPPEVPVDPATVEDAPRLPTSLAEAVGHFRASAVLAEALGEDLHETIAAVRDTEVRQFDGATDEAIVAATRARY